MTKEDGRIQFRHPLTGIRKTICTGLTGKGDVAIFKAMVAALIEAVKHGQEPDAQTREWCDKLEPAMREKIASVELIKRGATIPVKLDDFCDAFIAEKNPAPIQFTKFHQTKKRAIELFGADKNVRHLTKGDALRFSAWLVSGTGNAENTARKHRGRFSQMLAWGVDNRVLIDNPMKDRRIPTSVLPASQDRRHFLTTENALAILEQCEQKENWELATYFTLLRWGGLRAAEPLLLRWQHVDFGTKRITVLSPKTKHHEDGDKRIVPMFWGTPMEKVLIRLYAHAKPSQMDALVFPRMATHTTQAAAKNIEQACKAAGVATWPRMLQNLRATASNEILRQYGEVAESAWVGHSVKVAARNYSRVMESEFVAATHGQNPFMGRRVTSRVTSPENQPQNTQNDTGFFTVPKTCEIPGKFAPETQKHLENKVFLVGGTGLEPVTSSMSTMRSSQLS